MPHEIRSIGQIVLIQKYFPELTEEQSNQFEMLMPLFAEWNHRINLISRKDIEHFYERHVLHSLAIARFIQFKEGAHVIDVGTGGGFPGIPLAIIFPQVSFTLVDSITKKIKVVDDIIQKLGLQNVETLNMRAEDIKIKTDYIISRATAPLTELINWTKHTLQTDQAGSMPDGWITLKGGDLGNELKPFEKQVVIEPISRYFSELFFETKKIVYLPYKRQ